MRVRPRPSTLFPYTTLFRSDQPSPRINGPAPADWRRPRPRFDDRRRVSARSDDKGAGQHRAGRNRAELLPPRLTDRKSTRLNSSHVSISYAVFCLKKKIDLPYRCYAQISPFRTTQITLILLDPRNCGLVSDVESAFDRFRTLTSSALAVLPLRRRH